MRDGSPLGAFRLRFPSAFLDPRDGTITLHRLCELVEKSG